MTATPNRLRVLGRLRLSRSTDESTSMDRQREIIQRWADERDHEVIGWAEDLDVSGSVPPFETPGLGPWLGERAPEWDVLCAWKLDRLGRDARQLSALFGWAEDHGKTVVSCSESIDLSNWSGRMLAGVIAGLAEGELAAVRERTLASRHKLRESGRWAGGKPPFGYRKVRRDDGSGWSLEIDPDAYKLVRRIVESVIDGEAITRLARTLNTEGVLTPGAYYAERNGKPVRESRWSSTTIRNMLRSKALRGFVHHKGETVRGDDGQPIQLAEPLVTLDEWELVQAILDRRGESQRGIVKADSSPLAGVISCLICGKPMYHTRQVVKGYEYKYYRCEDRHGPLVPADIAETLMEETFLDDLGDVEVRERVWVPGDSREEELREAVAGQAELAKLVGTLSSATSREQILRQIAALDAQIAELQAIPSQEAHWEYQPTGGTYGSVWKSSGTDQRRELLLRSGIKLALTIDLGLAERRSASNPGALRFELRVPEGVRERMASEGA